MNNKLQQLSRRRFIYCTAISLVLFVTTIKSIVPIPLGFFQPQTAASATDSDVIDWITRVEGQGSTVSAATSNAVTTFAIGMKADGVWTKVKRMSIYAGNTLDALKAPLVNDIGSTTDALNSFASTNWSESTGLTGTGPGTSKYISTGVNPASSLSSNNLAMAVFVRVAANVTNSAIGTQTTAPAAGVALGVSYNGTTFWDSNISTNRASVFDGGGYGFYVGSRTATNVSVLYKDGTPYSTNTAASLALPSSTNTTVHAIWDDDGSPVAASETTQTLELYAICDGLTAADVTAFHTRYATLRSALGRTPSGDQDFAEWLARVRREGSDVASTNLVGISNLVVGLKADGIWSNLLRLNIYSGTNLTAATVPLRIFVGPTVDIMVAFDEADYAQSTGLTGDGAAEYVNPNVQVNDAQTSDHNIHFAVYVRTGSDASTHAMGAQDGVNDTALLVSFAGTTYWDAHIFTTARISAADSAGTGLYTGVRTSSTNQVLYKAGAVLASGTGSGGTRTARVFFVQAFNNSGVPINFNARTFELYSYGLGLTQTQATNYHLRYSTARTTMGR